MSTKPDPRIDEKIAQAPAFARPIMAHLRRLIHTACPDVEETIKWQMPFFDYRGKPLCRLASFKAHCSFGFWHPAMEAALMREGLGDRIDESAGLFGRITRIEDLPAEPILLRLIAEAARHNESDGPARPRPPDSARKPEAEVPADLTLRLACNAAATKTFEGFSHSQRREYIEWINEAKREETRQKRLDTTLEWLAEGKSRYWKYADCSTPKAGAKPVGRK